MSGGVLMLDFKIFSGSKRLVGLDIGSSSLKLAEVISSSHGRFHCPKE